MAVTLRLGRKYRNRDGAIVEIISDKAGKTTSKQRYQCDQGRRYYSDGCWGKDRRVHEWDLIEEITDTPRRATPAPAPARTAPAAPPARQRYEDSYAPVPAPVTERTNSPMSKLFGRIFGGQIGAVTDSSFKMSLRGAAVRTNDGGYAAYDPTAKAMVDVSEFLIDADNFLYKLPKTQLAVGDAVVITENPLDVIFAEKVDPATGEVSGLNPRTNRREVWQPRTNMLGVKFFVVLTSLVNFGALAGGDTSTNNLLPLLALTGGLGGKKGSGGSDIGDMLPLLLLSNPGAAGGQQNALLPLMLLSGKGGENGSMVEMLLMSQMFGGAGANPFGNIFGGAPAAPAAPAAPPA